MKDRSSKTPTQLECLGELLDLEQKKNEALILENNSLCEKIALISKETDAQLNHFKRQLMSERNNLKITTKLNKKQEAVIKASFAIEERLKYKIERTEKQLENALNENEELKLQLHAEHGIEFKPSTNTKTPLLKKKFSFFKSGFNSSSRSTKIQSDDSVIDLNKNSLP